MPISRGETMQVETVDRWLEDCEVKRNGASKDNLDPYEGKFPAKIGRRMT